jgi:peroxiredoxin Q/BCP
VNSLPNLVVCRERISRLSNRLLSATMVELRKRKTPPPAPAPAPKKERKTKAAKANGKPETVAEPAAPEPSAVPAAAPEPETKAASSGTPKPGDKIDLEGFGGEVETNDGRKVTLKSLVDESKEGVVLFTYPKASTPGCESLRSHWDTVSPLFHSLPHVAKC